MAIIRAQVTFPNVSTGLPRDVAMNTFHFRTPPGPPSGGDLVDIANALIAFYNDTAPGAVNPVRNWLSAVIGSACTIRLYDLADAEPRVPVLVTPWVLGDHGGSALPNEVSVVLSFRADPVPGVPAARLRGRVYIGPLNQTGSELSAGDLRPSIAITDSIARSGDRLRTRSLELGVEWVVRSVAGLMQNAVARVHVDNAYDTQRRRGLRPTTRVTIPA